MDYLDYLNYLDYLDYLDYLQSPVYLYYFVNYQIIIFL